VMALCRILRSVFTIEVGVRKGNKSISSVNWNISKKRKKKLSSGILEFGRRGFRDKDRDGVTIPDVVKVLSCASVSV